MAKSLYFILAFHLLSSIISNAQVTIGSDVKPSEGALIDFKEYNDIDAKNGGRTANKGIILPRVTLNNLNSLIDIDEIDDSKPKSYIGLTVYNVKKY